MSHLRHYRGKRLRPALLLLTAKAVGDVAPAHHTLAAVVEMVHTATLVHDDVLDEADTRRHARTVNAEWGNKVRILLGDMLFTHAFHLSSTVDRRACELIGEATNRVCAGELKQVCERGNLHLTEADYFEIVDGKTAALTEVSARLGALYAGADEALADRLAGFGRDLGIAFQIADDLLDLTGHEGTAGKTLGTDLDQQKLTLPLIHALHNAGRKGRGRPAGRPPVGRPGEAAAGGRLARRDGVRGLRPPPGRRVLSRRPGGTRRVAGLRMPDDPRTADGVVAPAGEIELVCESQARGRSSPGFLVCRHSTPHRDY